MNNFHLKNIIIFILCGSSYCAPFIFSQNYTLSNWMVEDGLSSNDVKELLQDEEGFIWTATEHGLNKFDGYQFTKYRYNPADSTSIGANYINSFCEDENGNIWIRLGVGILSKFNQRTKEFTNYSFPKQNTYIFDLKYISGLGISVATSQGWFYIDTTESKLKLIAPIKSPKNKFYNVFPLTPKTFFLNTEKGFEKFHLDTKSIEPIFYLYENDTLLLNVHILNLYQDSKNIIWIKTESGALCYSKNGQYFNIAFQGTSNFRELPKGQFFFSENKKHTKWTFSNTNELVTTNDALQIWKTISTELKDNFGFSFLDKKQNIWVFTRSNQLLKWDGTAWEFILDFKNKLEFWEVTNVFVDDKNGIWLASKGKGIWRINHRKWAISSLKNSITNQAIDMKVTALFSDNEKYMWVGTTGNVYKYYFESEAFIPLFSDGKNNPLEGFGIHQISKTQNGELCIASNFGVFLINEEGENFRHLTTGTYKDIKFQLNYIRCVVPDSSGKIWIGSTNGLYLYDAPSDKYHAYFSDKENPNSIRNKDIHSLKKISPTTFLVGYVKEGVDLMTINPANNSISFEKITYKNSRKQQFDLMTTNTFYQSGNEIWIGAFSKGLLKLDLENLTMSPISEDFPIIPNVQGILKDNDGKLWVSSIDGMRSINPDDKTFHRFSKSSGLRSNDFYSNSSIEDSEGNLYFGSTHGINKIEPSKWKNQDTIATPIITRFKKYDESIIFDAPLNEVNSISLNHQDDFITIDFVSPTYDNPDDIRYAYQLEGFDKNWRYCQSQRFANYTNLPPGEYLFKVKAGNKGGFSNSKTKQLQIIVTPPFWQTKWFMLLTVGLLVFTFWFVHKIQWQFKMNRLKTINEIRQKAADDFHDELGHRLTKISLFVETLMIQKDSFPKKSAYTLKKIQENANELFHSTRDFIWAMNPSKDSAIESIVLLRDFGYELFTDTDINFETEGIENIRENLLLDMDLKRQLVMIFKEAMNNALKHSHCKNVILKVEQQGTQITISLHDDGNGFAMSHEKFGYGLGSMINRSKQVGGHLEVNTDQGNGTKILFKINTI